LLQSRWLVSGRSSSGSERALDSPTFVCTSFALRGAPCGDDSRPRTALRRYHDQESPERGRPNNPETFVVVGVGPIRKPPSQIAAGNGLRLFERHPVLGQVDTRLLQFPGVPRHLGTVGSGPYPGLIAC
jgi:hypothetical protein